MPIKSQRFEFTTEDGQVFTGQHRNFHRTASIIEGKCLQALAKVYPGLIDQLPIALEGADGVRLTSIDAVLGARDALARFNSVNEFCETVSTLIELSPFPFTLPTQGGTAEDIVALYDFLMLHEDLFDELTEKHQAVLRPNGAVGSPEALLTAEEKADPT